MPLIPHYEVTRYAAHMPRSTTTHGAAGALSGADPTDLVREVVLTCQRVFDSLQSLVVEPPSRRGGGRGVVTGSSPSWHAQAAYLVLELGGLVREVEADLRRRVTGQELVRGSSDANTFLALAQVAELASLAVREARWEAWRRLDGWCLRGRTCLGEVEPLALLPRLPGHREPHCPYCHRQTLRHQVLAGLVRCVNPTCRDDDDQRPVAVMVLGRISGEPILTWRDGTSGVPQGEPTGLAA